MDSADRSTPSASAAASAVFTPPSAMPAITTTVEICTTSIDEAVAAQSGGAHRIELCSRLDLGGLTPEPELIAGVRHHVSIPVFVLVRPRAGDFVFDETELAAMRRSILRCRALGADGIVTGVLTRDGMVDEDAMQMLVAIARPLAVTFHRAVDRTRDQIESTEVLLSLGVDRVLSSGGAPTAWEGVPTLAAMVRRAGEALTVVAGGHVRPDHAASLVRETGVREIHAHLGKDDRDVAALLAAVAH